MTIEEQMYYAARMHLAACIWCDECRYGTYRERCFALSMAAEFQERAAAASKAVRVRLGIEPEENMYAEPVRVW